jgi:hypothetical protein
MVRQGNSATPKIKMNSLATCISFKAVNTASNINRIGIY